MEENTNQVEVEETAPQVETNDNADEVTTDSTAQKDTIPDENKEEVTETNEGQTEGQAEQPLEETPFISVKYNHEVKNLTQREAQLTIQKAMKNESLMGKLRILAARNGNSTFDEFVDYLVKQSDDARLERLRGSLTEDNPELLESIIKLEDEKYRQQAGVIAEEEAKVFESEYKSESEKLANDLIELQKEFPDIKGVKDVPDTVIKSAIENKISLFDAYLRYQFNENKKIKQAEVTEKEAIATTTGSAASNDTDATSPAIQAMLKGLWGE
jgi:hypothetical protein